MGFTDNEIIRAYGCCYLNHDEGGGCDKCPCKTKGKCSVRYGFDLEREVFNLLNRQKEEIERLSDRNYKCLYLSDDETTEYCVDGPCPNYKTEAQIRTEAIKECMNWVLSLFPEDKNFTTISRFTVNRKLKEMVGDAE